MSSRAKEVELPKVPDGTCRGIWGIQAIFRLCAGYRYSEKGICPVSEPYISLLNLPLVLGMSFCLKNGCITGLI